LQLNNCRTASSFYEFLTCRSNKNCWDQRVQWLNTVNHTFLEVGRSQVDAHIICVAIYTQAEQRKRARELREIAMRVGEFNLYVTKAATHCCQWTGTTQLYTLQKTSLFVIWKVKTDDDAVQKVIRWMQVLLQDKYSTQAHLLTWGGGFKALDLIRKQRQSLSLKCNMPLPLSQQKLKMGKTFISFTLTDFHYITSGYKHYMHEWTHKTICQMVMMMMRK
jgi:hypothetical protein